MRSSRVLPKSKLISRRQATVELARGKKVLHIGMGGFINDPAMTEQYIQTDLLANSMHGQLSKTAASLTGLDINPTTIEAMKKHVPGEYILGSILDPSLPEQIQDRYDLVLFLDVIEHLDDFRTALTNVSQLLAPGGQILITTCNAYCFDSILKMFCRYESCHEEHTSYFSFLTIKRLLEMNQLTLNDFAYTLEERTGYSSLSERIGYNLMKLIARFFPQFAQGIWVLASPQPVTRETVKATVSAASA